MGRMKRKYESGSAIAYITRKQACRKLQLDLPDFRRLCILKGIYPHEPRNRRKVGRGSSTVKTYFFKKDITFLLHEPIINKFREFRIFIRKMKKACDKKQYELADRLETGKPVYNLDHIVKERYPSFIDALRDMDDCLCLVFLFATLPHSSKMDTAVVQKCRRLSVEFMHYVIAGKCLRKVFVSVKGIYYQAEISGQTITWVAPHARGYEHPTKVDFRIMSIFVHFYTTLLGFVNFRLFSKMNIKYPLSLELPEHQLKYLTDMTPAEKLTETIAALTQSLQPSTVDIDSAEVDDFTQETIDGVDTDVNEEARQELLNIKRQQTLFAGKKFFLGREVDREALTFIIRSCGGLVSWDATQAVGASYPSTDRSITHQVVDRSTVPSEKYLNRYYIQPQWVFDSFNARKLLDVKNYFPSVVLPPHLSPFVEAGEGEYVPPERVQLLQRADEEKEDDFEESDMEKDDQDETDEESEEEDEVVQKAANKKEPLQVPAAKKLTVVAGKPQVVDKEKRSTIERNEQKKLAVMMIPKKKRRLYNKIMYANKKKAQETRTLTEKRVIHDAKQELAKSINKEKMRKANK